MLWPEDFQFGLTKFSIGYVLLTTCGSWAFGAVCVPFSALASQALCCFPSFHPWHWHSPLIKLIPF